jgi:hypothetical protein
MFQNTSAIHVHVSCSPQDDENIMTWLTVTEYLCHKWPRICSVCRNHNPVLSSFMTYQQVCNKSKTTRATCDAGTTHSSRTSQVFSGVCVARSLVFDVMICRSFFVLFWPLCCLSFHLRLLTNGQTAIYKTYI